ncbi:MAG: peptidylprolyl isomerase [Myxococcales bacterium]|nr:peptidylprolyl isomerase [Myxococcales bacterium]MCB9732991.1 peptidylprolyl isomerase [Deltaproteobacteria bacterium]
MKVKKNCLVRVQYRVSDEQGNEIDRSDPEYPLEFVCGRGDVITGLERGLIGLEPGATKTIVIPPEDAYGAHQAELVKPLPRAGFPAELELSVGQRFSYRGEKGAELMYQVREIRPDHILADFNHPLAGKSLRYEVTVLDVTDDFVDGKI